MDDGIAACKDRERLRPQQAMSIGNRANGSHPAQSDYRSGAGEPPPQHRPRGANCKMPPEFAKRSTELCCRLPRPKLHAQLFKRPVDHRRLIVEWLTL